MIGKKAPADMPSTIARIDWEMLACSAVRATLAMMNINETPAATTQSTSATTARGEPNETSKNRLPTTSRTEVATTPRM